MTQSYTSDCRPVIPPIVVRIHAANESRVLRQTAIIPLMLHRMDQVVCSYLNETVVTADASITPHKSTVDASFAAVA